MGGEVLVLGHGGLDVRTLHNVGLAAQAAEDLQHDEHVHGPLM